MPSRARAGQNAPLEKIPNLWRCVFFDSAQTVTASGQNALHYDGSVSGQIIYTYVSGNPISLADPTGQCPICIMIAYRLVYVGVVAALGDVAFQLVLNGGEVKCIDWGEAATMGVVAAAGDGAVLGLMKIAKIYKARKAAKKAKEAKEAAEKAAREAAREAAGAIRRHHSWPKYLGGAEKQDLVPLSKSLHDAFHSGLDKILARQKGTKYYENLSSAARDQVLQDLRDFTQAFDAKYGTKLLDAMRKNGFPL